MAGRSWESLYNSYKVMPGSWQKPPCFFIQGLRFITSNRYTNYQPRLTTDSETTIKDDMPAPPPIPTSAFSNWMKWVLGSLITLLQLPFWKMKWDNLYRLEGKVEKVVEEVETVAEVVEKVATTADKALAEVANALPDKSKLKETAQVMEHVSEVIAHDAHLIHDIIQKADDVKQDMKSLVEKGHVPRNQ